MFHLVNAGSEAQQTFSIDDHDLWIVAVGGLFVKPQKVQVVYLLVGSRFTVVVQLNQSDGQYTMRSTLADYGYQILAGFATLIVGGDADQAIANKLPAITSKMKRWQEYDGRLIDGAVTHDEKTLAPYDPQPPPIGPADLTFVATISSTGPVSWFLPRESEVAESKSTSSVLTPSIQPISIESRLPSIALQSRADPVQGLKV